MTNARYADSTNFINKIALILFVGANQTTLEKTNVRVSVVVQEDILLKKFHSPFQMEIEKMLQALLL